MPPEMPRTLTEIADAHGTDKGTIGPDAWLGAHHYTDVYEGYFAPLRWSELDLLEIGIGLSEPRVAPEGDHSSGASLKTWYEYFPNARIYGVDVEPARHLDNERIRTFVADQGDPESLRAFVERMGDVRFDVIIDDGSHRPDHQQLTLGVLFPMLKPGGLYFIEDLKANGLDGKGSGEDACRHVRDTRTVLRAFKETGAFAAPHALTDAAYLREHIAYVAFHRPQALPDLRGFLARLLRHRMHWRIPWRPGTERLCAIFKAN